MESFFFVRISLGKFESAGIKLIIGAFFGEQFFVVASFDNTSVLQNHDCVGISDGGQTVCNDKYGTSVHQCIHTALNDCFGTGINAGSSFVQNEYRRIGNSGSCDGKQLALTL